MPLLSCRRNRILISVASILLICLLGAGLFLNYAANRHAEQEVRRHGELLLQQTSLLARPLLLANDRVSLNYLLNELVMLPYVRAARLHDQLEGTVARAGETGGLEMQRPLAPDNRSQLTFWLDPAPLAAPLQHQLKQAGLFALLALLATLLTLWWWLREPAAAPSDAAAPTLPETPPAEPEADRDDGQAYPEAAEPPQGDRPASTPEPAFADAIAAVAPAAADSPQPATAGEAPLDNDCPPAPERAETRVTEDEIPFISEIVRDAEELQPAPQPAPASAPPATSAEPETPHASPTTVALAADTATATATLAETPSDDRREPTFETDSLVQLLRPEQRGRTMPQFQPSMQPGETMEPTAEPDSDEDPLDLDEQELDRDRQPGHETTASAKSRNPLKALREEVQLDLYTFEQELELILPGAEAGYCLYIDAASAHRGNVEQSERQQLLRVYARMAGQSAAIYGGTAHQLANGDLRIDFDRPSDDDNHGINAVCAALLFNLLYKGYNQSRIRAFLPVMNLHMALARGRLDKPDLLVEEARFLTRTTQSNELISHTALTEVPDLKRNLLANADVRREDEDKVLIFKLSGHYQELLQKQANHLLKKLLA